MRLSCQACIVGICVPALIVSSQPVLVCHSQEHLAMPKTKIDGQKVTRPGKQYSAVASRYAAPLASKKQVATVGDGPHSWQSNGTKLPFITGAIYAAFLPGQCHNSSDCIRFSSWSGERVHIWWEQLFGVEILIVHDWRL